MNNYGKFINSELIILKALVRYETVIFSHDKKFNNI